MALKTVNTPKRNTQTAYDRYGRPVRRYTSAQYQQGSAVRHLQEVPAEQVGYDYYKERRYRQEYERKEQNRRQKRKQYLTRKKENALTAGNLFVIGFGAVMIVCLCVLYLSLMSQISDQSNKVTSMRKELVALQEENDTRYNYLNNSMSLDEIRQRAVEDLGMVNATADQIVTYQNPTTDYVTQTEAIPQ